MLWFWGRPGEGELRQHPNRSVVVGRQETASSLPCCEVCWTHTVHGDVVRWPPRTLLNCGENSPALPFWWFQSGRAIVQLLPCGKNTNFGEILLFSCSILIYFAVWMKTPHFILLFTGSETLHTLSGTQRHSANCQESFTWVYLGLWCADTLCVKMPCALWLGIFAGDSTWFGKHCSALGRKTRIWRGSNCCDRPRKSSARLCWVRALLLVSVGRDFTLWKCFRSMKCCPSQRADRAGLNFPLPPLTRLIFIPVKIFPLIFQICIISTNLVLFSLSGVKTQFEWPVCFPRSYLSTVGHQCIAHITAMPWHLFCVCNPTPSCFGLRLQAAI